jgi:purine-nucleoside phosphorylase
MSVTPSLPTHDLEARVDAAVAAIRARSSRVPQVALTLGSGLGGAVSAIESAEVFPTADLPHWPRSTMHGHAGKVVLGTWKGVDVVALAGRSHRYEGYTLDRVTFGVRVMRKLGATVMVFTNAVGAIHPELRPADLMLAVDHMNFIGKHGLFSPAEVRERRLGRRVASPYSVRLREALTTAAERAHVKLHRGTLMGGHGPTYETAAEVRMAGYLGADVACMSTVHEVTLAAELGAEAASISCITNRATGLSDKPLSHEEVTEVADLAAASLRSLVEEFLAGEAARPS